MMRTTRRRPTRRRTTLRAGNGLFRPNLVPGLFLVCVAMGLAACDPPAPSPVPPDSFSFGVFGDGPYFAWEQGRYRRVLRDAERAGIDFMIHVGDILASPCSDAVYRERRDGLNALPFPVVYTPGDNEWTDCHGERPGGYDPLDRLASLRRTFFSEPGRSLGREPLALESQAEDPAFSTYMENARWRRGGFVFATLHVVGSSNGLEDWDGRAAAHDAEVEERTAAAVAWLDATFDVAEGEGAAGLVLALHAEMGLTPDLPSRGYEAVLARLRERVARFDGPVLLVHGDDHVHRVDRPLRDADGEPLSNFTRVETYGSPDIGWVRVVVDTLTGTFDFEPRRMRGWW